MFRLFKLQQKRNQSIYLLYLLDKRPFPLTHSSMKNYQQKCLVAWGKAHMKDPNNTGHCAHKDCTRKGKPVVYSASTVKLYVHKNPTNVEDCLPSVLW